ncbi:MAG: YdcF family protein [Leptospiraceae bacterium]|nr:YdcF family protein [Leptospiraceae bacterium]MDW8305638.1 ElyC/SanA/YdcF family protein [Leptospiraceae bacterium]
MKITIKNYFSWWLFIGRKPIAIGRYKSHILFFLLFLLVLAIVIANLSLDYLYKDRMYTKLELIPPVEAILIPGASVIRGKKPSGILIERLEKGIELYRYGKAPKIILSGDNSGTHYNEVLVMKNFCLRKGVRPDDLFLDHSGVRTLDTLFRSKHVFLAHKIIFVTQRLYMGRALYLADNLGLIAYGYLADSERVSLSWQMYLREFLARYRALYDVLTKNYPPLPTETFPLSGSAKKSWEKLPSPP